MSEAVLKIRLEGAEQTLQQIQALQALLAGGGGGPQAPGVPAAGGAVNPAPGPGGSGMQLMHPPSPSVPVGASSAAAASAGTPAAAQGLPAPGGPSIGQGTILGAVVQNEAYRQAVALAQQAAGGLGQAAAGGRPYYAAEAASGAMAFAGAGIGFMLGGPVGAGVGLALGSVGASFFQPQIERYVASQEYARLTGRSIGGSADAARAATEAALAGMPVMDASYLEPSMQPDRTGLAPRWLYREGWVKQGYGDEYIHSANRLRYHPTAVSKLGKIGGMSGKPSFAVFEAMKHEDPLGVYGALQTLSGESDVIRASGLMGETQEIYVRQALLDDEHRGLAAESAAWGSVASTAYRAGGTNALWLAARWRQNEAKLEAAQNRVQRAEGLSPGARREAAAAYTVAKMEVEASWLDVKDAVAGERAQVREIERAQAVAGAVESEAFGGFEGRRGARATAVGESERDAALYRDLAESAGSYQARLSYLRGAHLADAEAVRARLAERLGNAQDQLSRGLNDSFAASIGARTNLVWGEDLGASMQGLADQAARDLRIKEELLEGVRGTPQEEAARSQVHQAQLALQQARRAAAIAPTPMSTVSALSRTGADIAIAQMGFGGSMEEVREALRSQVGTVEGELRRLESEREKALRAGTFSAGVEAEWRQRYDPLRVQAAQLRAEYDQGWTHRLISEAYGMEGAGLLTARVTRREAGLAGISAMAFGGTEEQSRRWLQMPARYLSRAGTGSPAGAADAAMLAGEEAGPVRVQLDITLRNESGVKLQQNTVSVDAHRTAVGAAAATGGALVLGPRL